MTEQFPCAVEIIEYERLREIDFGVLDGLTKHGIAHFYPEEEERRSKLGKYHHRPPAGENYPDVAPTAQFLEYPGPGGSGRVCACGLSRGSRPQDPPDSFGGVTRRIAILRSGAILPSFSLAGSFTCKTHCPLSFVRTAGRFL